MIQSYKSSQPDTTLESYKSFLDYLHSLCSETVTEDELQALYDQPITVSYDTHSVQLPFNAITYNFLVDLIETIIKEY